MEEKKKNNVGRKYGVPKQSDAAYETSKLKWIRQMKGFSQQSLADASGVKVRSIRLFEQSDSAINGAAALTVYKLASTLGVTMEQLINP